MIGFGESWARGTKQYTNRETFSQNGVLHCPCGCPPTVQDCLETEHNVPFSERYPPRIFRHCKLSLSLFIPPLRRENKRLATSRVSTNVDMTNKIPLRYELGKVGYSSAEGEYLVDETLPFSTLESSSPRPSHFLSLPPLHVPPMNTGLLSTDIR